MRQSHLILSNALIMWASRILLLIPQLVLVPYLIGTIGEAGYGVYALIWALMMSIDNLVQSLQSGVVKYGAGFLSQGRIEEVNKTVSSSFVYCLGLSFLGCIAIAISAALYDGTSAEIRPSLFALAVLALVVIPLTPYVGIIQSTQRYYVDAIAQTASRYAALALVVAWFAFVAPSVEALIFIMMGTLFLSRLAQVPFAYRFVPGLRNRSSLFDVSSFRSIAAFGGAIVFVGACLAVNSTGVRWLMSSLVSTQFVTKLVIMTMPALLLTQIIGATTITIMPATSAYQATNNQRLLSELLIRGVRYTTVLILAALLVGVLLMRDVIAIWVGSEYVYLAPYALALFAGQGFMMSASISHHMLKGMGKLRAVVLIYLVGFVFVPIGLILVLLATLDSPYVALTCGLFFGYVVCGCLQIMYCVKTVGAKFTNVLVRGYLQPLSVAVVVAAIVFGIVNVGGAAGLAGRACVGAGAAFLFFGGCYIFAATDPERQQLKALIRSTRHKLAAVFA